MDGRMKKLMILIIVYLIIMGISFLVGLDIRLNHTKSNVIKGTTCENGICPPSEEYTQ